MNNKLLITGGCGFIGTNVALYFAERGWDVQCIDNFSRPGSRLNETLLKEQVPGITISEVDVVRDRDALTKLVVEGNFKAIIHAAAQVAVTSSVSDPLFDFEQNARGTLHVLDAARRAPEKPIVLFTSTNKVYGELEHLTLAEEKTRYVLPDRPQGVSENEPIDFHSPYGCSKGAADQYVRDWKRIYDVPTVVFRQSCIYGAHQFGIVDQGWIAYLSMQALFGRPITIFGNGKQVRDVLHIDDLARAMEKAIEEIEHTSGQIYNMGGGANNTSSILEFVEFLKTRVDTPFTVSFGDWRPGDQRVYISDITKAKEDFGWEPAISFDAGFEKMFSWIEDNTSELEEYV